MLQKALGIIQSDLNSYLKLKFDFNEDIVLLSNFVGVDGTSSIKSENKVIVTLVNLEHETVIGLRHEPREEVALRNNPIHLNAYVLLSSYFGDNNYAEALKFLSEVVGFFQGKQVFDHNNTPSLPNGIAKLIFKMQTYSFQELSHLWGMLGAKYLPSVVYQMRLIAIDSERTTDVLPSISGTETSGRKV